MRLEGSLDVLPLRELIEMTVYSSVTGAVNIEEAHQSGKIYLYDGKLYHVSFGELSGVDALARLFALERAHFCFVGDEVSNEISIWEDPASLVERAALLGERWKRILPFVPNLHYIPRLLISLEDEAYRVSSDHWEIAAAVDGQKTIQDLSESLNWEAIEICEAIAQMSAGGVIRVDAPTPEVVREPEPEDNVRKAPTTRKPGVLERLLAKALEMSSAQSQASKPKPNSHNTAPQRTVNRSREEDAILHLLRS